MRRRSTASGSPADPAESPEPFLPRPRHKGREHPSDAVWEATAALRAMGIDPSRALGQNFLVSPATADQEAALVDVAPETPVFEIGGGLGELTRALLRREIRPITVIEKDPRLAAFLTMNLPRHVTVRQADALAVGFPAGSTVVGNLPFSTATAILEHLLVSGIEHGVFLVQREVGERLAATPGNRSYGPLTILSRVHGEFVLGARVPSAAFFPPPRVEGTFIVYRRDPLEPAPADPGQFKQLVLGAFAQRRKMLWHTLPGVLQRLAHKDGPVDSMVTEAGWPTDWKKRRAEEIAPVDYVRLANLAPRRR